MSTTPIIEAASALSDQALVELLFRVLFLLAVRGVATPQQIQILTDLQVLVNPCLRVA